MGKHTGTNRTDPTGDLPGDHSPASERIITIGRLRENTVVLNHANVSSRHARLIFTDDSIILEDLGSTNGTSIGKVENKIDRATVRRDDTVFFGSTSYEVVDLIERADQGQHQSRPDENKKATDPVPTDPPTPNRTSMAIGGVVAFLVATALFAASGFWQRENQVPNASISTADTDALNDATNVPSPNSDSIRNSDAAYIASPTTDDSEANAAIVTEPERTTKPELSPEDQMARSIFILVCSDTSRETPFRVGTAFAVAEDRIATTAAAIEAMKALQTNGFPDAYLYCPATDKQIKIQTTSIHPQYARWNTRARKAQQKHDQIFDQLESDPPKPDTFESVKKQLIAAQIEAIEALEQRTSFDAGLLIPETNVDHWINLAKSARPPRPNQKLIVTGYAFDLQDPFFDPTLSMPLVKMQSRVKQVTPASSGTQSRLVAGGTDSQLQNAFLGCPALNVNGNVVGIYSRPTPPKDEQSEPAITTFDAVLFQRINECNL